MTLVGVIHLPPLPGSPRARASVRAIARDAAAEARLLVEAGFDGVLVENFGDAPFFKDRVPPVTVSAMTACALAVRDACPDVPLGLNVLRNDVAAALSIAVAVEASVVRVNVLVGARVTDQGIIEGRAAEVLRLRRELSAGDVAIWADVDVKHSAPLAARSLTAEVHELEQRALADAVLVTGEATGALADVSTLAEVRAALRAAPLYVASGATADALGVLASLCDGVIVGSAVREGGRAGAPLDPRAVHAFADGFQSAFRSAPRAPARAPLPTSPR
jgi:membrane complex biogenesis BtpA family protein